MTVNKKISILNITLSLTPSREIKSVCSYANEIQYSCVKQCVYCTGKAIIINWFCAIQIIHKHWKAIEITPCVQRMRNILCDK